jgi:hypothetical protein
MVGRKGAYIAAANSDVVDADEDVMGVGKFWDGCVFEFGVLWAV